MKALRNQKRRPTHSGAVLRDMAINETYFLYFMHLLIDNEIK